MSKYIDDLERALIAYCEDAEGTIDGGKTARRFINQIRQDRNHHAREKIEEVLDRLEARKGTPLALVGSEKYKHGVVSLRAIQAERERINTVIRKGE